MRAFFVALGVVALLAGGLAATADTTIDLQAFVDAAPSGAVIDLPPGVYTGGITIDKPLTLRGEGEVTIDGGGEGRVITVTAPDVTLEGLVVRGSGDSLDREDAGIYADGAPRLRVLNNRLEDVLFGIFLYQAPDAVVKGNTVVGKDLFIARRGDAIRLWESHRSVVEGNVVDGARDTVFWFCDDIVIRGNRISNGRYGLHFMYSDGALVEENALIDNSVGSFLMYSRDLVLRRNLISGNNGPSGYGVGLKDMDGSRLEDNLLVGNRAGVFFDNSPAIFTETQHFSGNLFAYNQIGVLFLPSVRGNVFWGNSFVDNTVQVSVQGGGRFEGNIWTRDGIGNYWSDYAGYDADGDGFGDVPYRLDDLYDYLVDRNPEVMIFADTPAAKALDLAARAFPVVKPRPKVEDPRPLITPPAFPDPPFDLGVRTSPRLLAYSLVMLALAGGIVFSTRARRTS
ncbi:MAG: nitrous oxide reductase family maturation protein NosD [Acidimicrobiia bacterium]